jgi:hypothetical protein
LTAATFSLTNTASSLTYVFYLSGQETTSWAVPYFYTLAGAVTISTTNGNVTGGEQDYNDGNGITSPGEPTTPDQITGGSLSVNSSGQGTLTVTTNNSNINSGTETLGVQFVNANHALIIQFDGNGTSSGSMDLQTATSASGSFAFILSGIDGGREPVAYGGVYTLNSGAFTGILDFNDNGWVYTGFPLTAPSASSSTDSYGRGVVSGICDYTGLNNLAYYVIGPEALRIIDIDVDATDAAVGSAYGQGTTTFTNSSLGSSVFGIESSSWGNHYAAGGQIAVPSAGSFTGVGDEDNEGTVVSASPFDGTYYISNAVGSTTYNGYGYMSASTTLGGISYLGLYMTDPNLNLMDPNNTSGGGGALILDLDDSLSGGTGVLVPQTDTTVADFNGNYAFGGQDSNDIGQLGDEFDFVGQGSVTASSGVFAGTGLVSDPFEVFATTPTDYSDVPFAGTVTPDTTNTGRYTISPLSIAAVSGSPVDFTIAIYQASAGQLFWVNEDNDSLFLGPVQQQGSLAGIPVAGAKKAVPETQVRKKH